MHMHKGGGSSLVFHFASHGYRMHTPNINGNPWSDGHKQLIDFWNYDRPQFIDFVDDLRRAGTNFICAEWNFLRRENRVPLRGVRWMTCIREPFERFVSCYKAHGGDEVFGIPEAPGRGLESFSTRVMHWSRNWTTQQFPICINRPNYYVRMLNGLGHDVDARIDESHLEEAFRVLSLFDAVLVLGREASFGSYLSLASARTSHM